MPEMSGAEVVRAIRATPAIAGCRIAMLSSSGLSPGERSVAKPVRRARLLELLAEVLSDAEPETAPVAAPLAAAQRRGRVLVADDNPVNQLVIETLLGKRGFAVDLAADGLEAVRRLDPDVHAAVFMDCQMPTLDGYGATARIRETVARHVPIIAMTAHAFAGDRERCLRAGMDDYLSKPIRAEDLDPVLERWLPAAGGLVDHARLRELQSAVDGMAEKVVDAFARTTPALLEELVAASDDEQRRRLAHKLKGGSQAVGALRLAESAGRLEEGRGDASELRPLYAETLRELRAAILPRS
jgi:CheY-like chemotaxis protein